MNNIDYKTIILSLLGPLGYKILLNHIMKESETLSDRQVWFEVTRQCPLKCSMCLVKNELTKSKVNLEWEKIYSIISDVNPDTVHLTGGEPLWREDICELLEQLSSDGIKINILTSGTVNPKLDIDRLCRVPNLSICISIDGPRDVHDKIRGVPGTLDKALAFANKVKSYVQLGAQSVIMGDNAESLKGIIDVCSSAGINRLSLNFERFNTDAEMASMYQRLTKAFGVEFPQEMVTGSVHEYQGVSAYNLKKQLFETVRYGLKKRVAVFPFPSRWMSTPESYIQGEKTIGKCRLIHSDSHYFDADGKEIICTNLRFPICRDTDSPEAKILSSLQSEALFKVCSRCCNIMPKNMEKNG